MPRGTRERVENRTRSLGNTCKISCVNRTLCDRKGRPYSHTLSGRERLLLQPLLFLVNKCHRTITVSTQRHSYIRQIHRQTNGVDGRALAGTRQTFWSIRLSDETLNKGSLSSDITTAHEEHTLIISDRIQHQCASSSALTPTSSSRSPSMVVINLSPSSLTHDHDGGYQDTTFPVSTLAI